ncbi:MAG: GreA/GreB family elongation factor [Phycisphaerae bacterium]|jgi:transcription elongation GreA/GreB family factor
MLDGLLELVKHGDLDGFETRCLELLDAGEVPTGALTTCFKKMEEAGDAQRVGTLAQMVLENINIDADPRGALAVAQSALHAVPDSATLRQHVVDLYRRVHAETDGFSAILESSGLAGTAPARMALRVLDFCLELKVGETLISRMDDKVAEVAEIDRARGLFTLRRSARTTTIPAREVVREYERVDKDDFRVLRQLYPERLNELIEKDPVALVVGLIHAHGGLINADELKAELAPRYIDDRQWNKWWTRTRSQLKRSPHIIIEGRAPVVLQYNAEGVSLEDETWSAIAARQDPVQWLATAENYLREMKSRKEKPDQALLKRFHNHIVEHVEKVRRLRPGEALACVLVLSRLADQGLPIDESSKLLAGEILRETRDPVALIATLSDDHLWERVYDELKAALPDKWPDVALALLSLAPASQLDALVGLLREAGRLDGAQRLIDDVLTNPLESVEFIYWFWKGPQDASGLNLPADSEVLSTILDTLSALGVTLNPPADVARRFRGRVKSALALRNYGRVEACLKACSAAAAVPLRRQIERLDELGPVARGRLLDLLHDAHPQLWVRRTVQLAPWEDPDILWATQAGLDRKTADRDDILNVKMHENAIRIGEAASHGDLSENSEYKFALEERDFLRGRLAQANRELALVRVLESHDVPIDSVGVGSRVTLRRTSDGNERVMTILGPFEADVDKGIYSYKAPVCQKLMGLHANEHITLTVDGSDQEFEIIKIENSFTPADG